MNLKHYMRGLGIGMVVTSLLLTIASGGKKDNLTDAEIISRAERLGMVHEDNVLFKAPEGGEEEQEEQEEEPEPPAGSVSAQSAGEASSVSADTLSNNGMSKSVDEVTAGGRGSSTSGSSAATGSPGGVSGSSSGSSQGRSGSGASASSSQSRSGSGASGSSSRSVAGGGKSSSSSSVKNTGNSRSSSSSSRSTGSSSNSASSSSSSSLRTSAGGSVSSSGSTRSAGGAGNASGSSRNGAGETVTIVIASGMGSTSVSRSLADAGLVPDAAAYDAYLCGNGYDKKLAAGSHEVPVGASLEEIARIITTR